MCYNYAMHKFVFVSYADIFRLVPHTIPVNGTTPTRVFAQMVTEDNPILRESLRCQLFQILARMVMVSCPSLKIRECQKMLPFVSFS